MKKVGRGTFLVVAGAIGASLVAVFAVRGQDAAYRAPRTADGAPDLNGIWQAMNTANWDIQDHDSRQGPVLSLGAAFSIPAGEGVVVGNDIPYKPEALAKKKENAEKWMTLDPEVKWYRPGIPRATYMPYPFQIVQSKDHVVFAYSYANASRIVYMNVKVEPQIDTWMGYASGRWEGETLVIESTGFNDMSWFDRAGNHHSDALHTIERISARSADTLNYEVTIEDPNVFTRTWKMSLPLYRHVQPNAQLTEFRCVEFSEEMLYGHLKKKSSE